MLTATNNCTTDRMGANIQETKLTFLEAMLIVSANGAGWRNVYLHGQRVELTPDVVMAATEVFGSRSRRAAVR